MTTLSARADGRRTKSTNGRNRERWSDYGAAGSSLSDADARSEGWTSCEADGAFKRVTPLPSQRTQPERAGTDLE